MSDKDDFNIFYIRFVDRVNTSQWSDERAKSELLNTLRTPTCERVIKCRKITLWTWSSLLEECRNRLCTKLSQPQLETELHELEPDENESPDEVMSRIEDIINRRDQESVDESTKDNLQAVTFLRLIHVHKRMYFYIKKKTTTLTEPYTLLHYARQYVKTHEHKDAHTVSLIQKELKLAKNALWTQNTKSENDVSPTDQAALKSVFTCINELNTQN